VNAFKGGPLGQGLLDGMNRWMFDGYRRDPELVEQVFESGTGFGRHEFTIGLGAGRQCQTPSSISRQMPASRCQT
jgi:hypothetical protein